MRSIHLAIPDIGAEYASADVATVTDADYQLWTSFADYNGAVASDVRRVLDVIPTDDPEPYADSAAQSADIMAGRFLVSRAHCVHPVWTVAENVDFRIAHDVLGHHVLGAEFDRDGEIDVYRYSLLLVPPEFHRALFVESIGQLAYACVTGDFGEQKVYQSTYFGEVE